MVISLNRKPRQKPLLPVILLNKKIKLTELAFYKSGGFECYRKFPAADFQPESNHTNIYFSQTGYKSRILTVL